MKYTEKQTLAEKTAQKPFGNDPGERLRSGR